MDDKKLIKSCQRGDKEAFHELISKYHPLVLKFLMKLSGDRDLVEDITQETFLKVIRKIEMFDTEGKASFSTYLLTIAKNSFIDDMKKKRRLKEDFILDEYMEITDNMEDFVDEISGKVDGLEVLEKLSYLSEEQRVAIRLKYVEELTLKEIGQILNLEPKTVKSRIHNGIVKLRRMLEGSD